MAHDYRRPGFHSVNSYLLVKDAKALLNFLTEVFDAEVVFKSEKPDGIIAHSEIQIGDSRVSVSEASNEWQPMPCLLYTFVPDVDAIYAKALAAGGKSVREASNMDYGERSAGFFDPSGNQWWVSAMFEAVSDEEIGKKAQEWVDKQG